MIVTGDRQTPDSNWRKRDAPGYPGCSSFLRTGTFGLRPRLGAMGQIKTLIPILFAGALMASLSGCDRSQPSPSLAGGSYIRMAIQSAEGEPWGLSVFPETAGTHKCVIRGGGPPPGILVPSICTTSILVLGNDKATVRFVQRWNARRFHADSGRRGHLSHTWEITISRAASGDHVVGSRDYGDFPPQRVR
jgi:hypothetical protein